MIPDPNCHCDQCEYMRKDQELEKAPNIRLEDLTILANKYRELHLKLFRGGITDMEGWPKCTDPRKRYLSFKKAMISLGGESAEYYLKISEALETLLWTSPPKERESE